MLQDKIITTGYSAIDRLIDNFSKPNLVLITTKNKSEFLFNISKFISVSAKIPTMVFSLEFKKEDIIHDLLYSCAHINSEKEIARNFDKKEWHNISNAIEIFKDISMVISDNTKNIDDIENLAKKFHNEHNSKKKLIVIDNLQLIEINENLNSKSKIESIIARINALAENIDSTILLLTNHSHNDDDFISKNATWVCL